jgi:AraC family transcriptional regulator of adaptative response / DNA-3-methyladenine glycosylase II
MHQNTILEKDRYFFTLGFRPPYHWKGILAFLAERAIPGVEVVDHRVYRRTIRINGCDGYFEASPDVGRDAIAVRVQIADTRSLYLIVERIRRLFDLNADWTSIAQSLRTDPALTARILAEPGFRVPGCWNGFELTIRAILGQEITLKDATVLAGQITKSYGSPISNVKDLTHLFPTPEVLADAKLEALGLTKERARTIHALARAVRDGEISFDRVVDSDAFLAHLLEIPGIDHWTAQYVAMRALGNPDAFPTGDKGILRALGLRNSCELEERAEAWRPWRSYASMYLWGTSKK